MKIKLQGEILELSHHKVVFWPSQKILFLSDLHLGRSAAHQKMALSLPEGAMEEDLDKLKKLSLGYDRILILGDFIHHPLSLNPRVIEIVKNWLQELPAKVDLILGNHDKALRKKLHWEMELHEKLSIGPFLFTHEPVKADQFVWAGHVHPHCKIEKGAEIIKLPCFSIDKDLGLLPAFGKMTGGIVIKPPVNGHLYAVTPTRVREIPS